MMKYRKPAALLAAALVGCVLLGGCGSEPATNPESTTTEATVAEELQTMVYEITEPFQSIRVEGGISDVRLIPTPGNCTVGCTDIPGLQYSAAVEDGTLVVRETGSTTETGAEILVCLNEPQFEELQITTASGNVDIPLDFVFTDVTLRSGSGELGYRGAAEGNLSCTTESGRILVTGITPASLTMESDSGQIVAQSVQVTGNLEAKTAAGAMVLSYVKCAEGSLSTQSGEMSLEQLLASGELTIDSNSGGVTLTDCDGAAMNIRTVSGSVSGTIQTDKTFTVTGESGTVSVPDTTGGPCNITTDSGTVTLSIGGAA